MRVECIALRQQLERELEAKEAVSDELWAGVDAQVSSF